MKDNVKVKFNEFRAIVDKKLDEYVEVVYPESIYESMKYSLLAGGKRLRPVIACEVATALGASIDEIIPTACAIEMLHCQSLIHDDLPCMDNDDFRRGKPTNHKVFGESTAVLAGDALLSFAPKLIIDKTPNTISAKQILEVLNEFFIAAGVDGIISGQIVDIDSEHKKISKETLSFIHEFKTSKLFQLAVRAGAIIANATEKQIEDLTLFAKYYGHAFQIYDDILDVTSTAETLGKPINSDIENDKTTFVTLLGLEKAKEYATQLTNNALDILNSLNMDTKRLCSLTKTLLQRNY